MHEFIHVIWVIVLLQIVIILIRLTAEVVLNNKSKFEKISLMFVSGKIRWLSWAMKEEWCCKWVDPALKGEKVTCACRGASCLLSCYPQSVVCFPVLYTFTEGSHRAQFQALSSFLSIWMTCLFCWKKQKWTSMLTIQLFGLAGPTTPNYNKL